MDVTALSVEPLELAPDDLLDNEAISSCAKTKLKHFFSLAFDTKCLTITQFIAYENNAFNCNSVACDKSQLKLFLHS